MTTRHDLVPQGLPYGDRQQYEAAASMAGVPRSSEGVAPSSTGFSPALPAGGGAAPPGADIFAETAPTLPLLSAPAPVTPIDRLAQIGATTNNVFVREVVRRVIEGE